VPPVFRILIRTGLDLSIVLAERSQKTLAFQHQFGWPTLRLLAKRERRWPRGAATKAAALETRLGDGLDRELVCPPMRWHHARGDGPDPGIGQSTCSKIAEE
jgi:hypothetical protein